eukprot:5791467-Amphidinium_carterae.1
MASISTFLKGFVNEPHLSTAQRMQADTPTKARVSAPTFVCTSCTSRVSPGLDCLLLLPEVSES